jgi:Spy/CpxP family protein refolding chaperone
MKTSILSTLILSAVLLSSTAFAQRPGNQENRQEKYRQAAPKNDFLTEDQKENLKNLRLETEKELKPLKNQLREAMAHQQTLTTADKADLSAINRNIDKMSELRAEMEKIKAKQHQAFRAQLTEEQLIQFDKRKERVQREMRNRNPRERNGRDAYPTQRKGA